MASFDCLQKPNMDIEPSKRLSRKDLKGSNSVTYKRHSKPCLFNKKD